MQFPFKKGTRYQATISLGVLEQLISNDTMKSGAEDKGFTNVSVTGDGRTRHGVADWDKPDASLDIPDQAGTPTAVGPSAAAGGSTAPFNPFFDPNPAPPTAFPWKEVALVVGTTGAISTVAGFAIRYLLKKYF